MKHNPKRQLAINVVGEPTAAGGIFIVAYTLIVCTLGMLIPMKLTNQISALEWMMIPTTFMIANLVEYAVHRWPLHRRYKGFSQALELHMVHHNYFDENEFSLKRIEDYVAVVFPAMVLNMMVLIVVLPGTFILSKIVNQNVALLFAATVMGYYLLMQVLHLAAHTEEKHWSHAIPGVAFLRNHHSIHHTQEHMCDVNFNFIIPVSDLLFGTIKVDIVKDILVASLDEMEVLTKENTIGMIEGSTLSENENTSKKPEVIKGL